MSTALGVFPTQVGVILKITVMGFLTICVPHTGGGDPKHCQFG